MYHNEQPETRYQGLSGCIDILRKVKVINDIYPRILECASVIYNSNSLTEFIKFSALSGG